MTAVSTMSDRFRLLRDDEFDACARLAAAAFDDYEFFTDYFPNAKKRARFIRRLIGCEFRVTRGRGGVTVVCEEDGRLTAAATLYPPEFEKPSDGAYIAKGYMGVLLSGGWRDANAWNDMNTKNDAPCHNIKGAWYVNMLVIAPDRQGHGLGTALIRDGILPFIRGRGGKQITLVTNSERNCRFYEKNGFTRFHEQSFEYRGKTLGAWSYRMEL